LLPALLLAPANGSARAHAAEQPLDQLGRALGLRMSPICDWRKLNHTTSPVRRSTSEA
jgi:hypothetical protein